jgi:hypothetical protein
LSAGLGGVLLVISFVLQSMKVSVGGLSLSASQVNRTCQSALGQIAQELSGSAGYNTPQSICGRAATIEDWKTITLWLGIALVVAGIGVIGVRAGWFGGRAGRPTPDSYD